MLINTVYIMYSLLLIRVLLPACTVETRAATNTKISNIIISVSWCNRELALHLHLTID